MFALILVSFAFADVSIQATAAGYAEVCSGKVSDPDCNRLIMTGTSQGEQEMLRLDCGSNNLTRCETAWTKVLTALKSRPVGMVGFVEDPPAPKVVIPPSAPQPVVEANVTVTTPPPPPAVEEDPCATGFKPKRGKGYVGSIRGKDGRECFGASTPLTKDTAVFYNNRHDPSLVVDAGIKRQEENGRTSAYVIEIGNDVQEQLYQLSPGKPLEVSLVEVSGVPEAVLHGTVSHPGIQYQVEGGDGKLYAQVSDRGLPYVSAVAGWTETRQILSSLVGHVVLYKFVQVSGDVWVYEGQRSFDYDAFAHGGVREILPAISNWHR